MANGDSLPQNKSAQVYPRPMQKFSMIFKPSLNYQSYRHLLLRVPVSLAVRRPRHFRCRLVFFDDSLCRLRILHRSQINVVVETVGVCWSIFGFLQFNKIAFLKIGLRILSYNNWFFDGDDLS